CYEQSKHDTNDGCRHREHDNEREQEILKLYGHHSVNKEDGEDKCQRQVLEGISHIFRLTANFVTISLWKVHVIKVLFYIIDHTVQVTIHDFTRYIHLWLLILPH